MVSKQSANLLPEYLKTDKNLKFLSGTLDPLLQTPQLERIDGFVGSKITPNYKKTDSYLKENPVEYKCVMTLRFDTLRMPSLNFNELDLSNTNMSDLHLPKRYIFSDSCIITTVEKYLEWFTIFEDLNKMINNTELDILVKSYNETLSFSPESLIFAKYLLHYKNLSNIGYFKYGFF